MSSNRFTKAMSNGNQKENVKDIKTAGIAKVEEVPDFTNDYVAKKLSDSAADIELFASQLPETKPQGTVPVMPPQYPEYNAAYSESVSPKSVKNGQKNVPNMFTQKNESKSIRKSLVLRPSSVKTAENYCAQNGGSFNELIQILLDNFIDEYGL